jgi:Na+-translocating ferredoxin:NAD+ oxidoreductase RnfG subunit
MKLADVLNPRAPWTVAVASSGFAGAVVVLLIIDPVGLIVGLAVAGGVLLYGTALIRWLRRP